MNAILFLVVFTLLALADGASCPTHWLLNEESCYLFVDEFVTWSTAEEVCRVMRGAMVEIDSMSENDFVAGQMKSKGLSNAWIGLQDFAQEGTFSLISNLQPPTFTQWADGEPNNYQVNHKEGGEDCVIINADSRKWDDYWCDDSQSAAVICEREIEDSDVIG